MNSSHIFFSYATCNDLILHVCHACKGFICCLKYERSTIFTAPIFTITAIFLKPFCAFHLYRILSRTDEKCRKFWQNFTSHPLSLVSCSFLRTVFHKTDQRPTTWRQIFSTRCNRGQWKSMKIKGRIWYSLHRSAQNLQKHTRIMRRSSMRNVVQSVKKYGKQEKKFI
jgi:hypothetical protein